jgi:hypothetical protein
MTSPKPPAHLSLAARRLFSSVLALYELERHDQAVLVKALEALDRAEACRQRIDAEGLTVASRFGELRPHPLLGAETAARHAFLAGMKQLALDFEPTTNLQRTAAARAQRWVK